MKGPISQFVEKHYKHFNAAALVDAALHQLPARGRAKLRTQIRNEHQHFDVSAGKDKGIGGHKGTIWDIPRTEIYTDWRKPPGDLGSELRRNNKLGVAEIAKREAKEVVELAIKEVDNAASIVVRFDRQVDRERGVLYSVGRTQC